MILLDSMWNILLLIELVITTELNLFIDLSDNLL